MSDNGSILPFDASRDTPHIAPRRVMAATERMACGEEVLFPIRLDDTVMKTKEAWAAKLRARLIGDFQRWKDHDAYKESFERMVRDLTKPP